VPAFHSFCKISFCGPVVTELLIFISISVEHLALQGDIPICWTCFRPDCTQTSRCMYVWVPLCCGLTFGLFVCF